MTHFWAEWGGFAYVAAFLWSFFEGETFVLLAAAVGRSTRLVDPWLLFACVWLGSFAGDQLWFALGGRFGPRILRRFAGAERRIAQVHRVLERYGALFVLSYRFAYGVRNIAAAACGVAGMNRTRFALLNLAAAGIWAATFVACGWWIAAWLGARWMYRLLGGIGLVAMLVIAWRAWRGRLSSPAASNAAAP
ncbi:MAG: DedA family protein [Rhodospirillales bacterium]|nr:DedA family protein [Rhodospirillales bacterium]MDE2197577.1 DedA family protein [Rhodospirillales bacterium]MDE2577029.1 DedA family protein [Rhodospirillales bacterium]